MTPEIKEAIEYITVTIGGFAVFVSVCMALFMVAEAVTKKLK